MTTPIRIIDRPGCGRRWRVVRALRDRAGWRTIATFRSRAQARAFVYDCANRGN
jgi:hypothetical protein